MTKKGREDGQSLSESKLFQDINYQNKKYRY